MAAERFTRGKDGQGLRRHLDSLGDALAALPPVVVFFGDGDYLRAAAVGRFRGAWSAAHPGGDAVTLSPDPGLAKPLGYPDLMAELGGRSLFAREKLVVLRRAERLLFPAAGRRDGAAADETGGAPGREKGFLDYLESPSGASWLAIESASLPKNRTVGRRLAGKAALVPCPALNQRDAGDWLRGRAGELGKRLEPAAAELLLQAHGIALGTLAAELDKLALFVDDREAIGAGEVREFLTGRIEFEIFGLTNAVEDRDLREALLYARRVAVEGSRDQKGKKDDGERSAHRALAMLGGAALGILRARAAMAEGASAADLAAAAGVSPWRAERLMAAARKYPFPEIRALADFVAGELRASHDTGGDARLSLERTAAKMAFRRGG
ncbi:MAG: hypothetical protein LBJ46_08890 [Planctomycetota bacterium]|jgi:DNA polymerase-3 subunit delta|nr:hypothetical protein [Planctomycetota bacterium]